MSNIKNILIFVTLTTLFNCSYCQSNNDTGWTTIKIVNGTPKKLFNIFFHFKVGKDTGWVTSFFEQRQATLLPNNSSTQEVATSTLPIQYYTYDFINNGQLVHKRIDSAFVLTGKSGIPIILSDSNVPIQWWETIWFKTLIILFVLFLCFY